LIAAFTSSGTELLAIAAIGLLASDRWWRAERDAVAMRFASFTVRGRRDGARGIEAAG
jgi:hypothetical protein